MIQAVWGGQLVKKALDAGKLVMVEEWVHLGSSSTDETFQSSDIWAQSHALNVRGIPWVGAANRRLRCGPLILSTIRYTGTS